MNNSTYDKSILFKNGFRDGFPIGLGYFAVSFSLGIAAKAAGLTPFQGLLASLLNNASAGEYAAFTLIAAGASYTEVAIMTFIANARYLLMSTALSQKFSQTTSSIHRYLIGFDVTDELFAITISRPGFIQPIYNYGAILAAAPCWAVGTALGIAAGNILPVNIVSALSVALYGMFLAVIIPPAKHDRVVGVLIILCFLASFISSVLPSLSGMSGGTRTIILTVVISALAAVCFPHTDKEEVVNNEK